MRNESLNQQVRAYQANPSVTARNLIVTDMMPFLERQARIATHGSKHLDEGDVLSVGSIALMSVLDTWPGDVDGDFEGYAATVIQRAATKAAIEARTNVSIGKYKYAKSEGETLPTCTAMAVSNGSGDFVSVVDLAADVHGQGVPESLDLEAFNAFMTQIDPAEQRVMQLHYTAEKNVDEIAGATGLTTTDVQRLLEHAHLTIRDRLLDASVILEGIDMTKFPEDVLEIATTAIVEGHKKQIPPDRWMADYLQRDHATRVSSLNLFCKMACEAAAKLKRNTSPSFAPPTQANRQPPRGLDAIIGANVVIRDTMLDTWRMRDGRKLGDVTGADLERYAISELRQSAKHKGRATFYDRLRDIVLPEQIVRDVVTEDTAAKLYQQACEKASIEFEPTIATSDAGK